MMFTSRQSSIYDANSEGLDGFRISFIMIFLFMGLIILGWQSCAELEYRYFSRETIATVVRKRVQVKAIGEETASRVIVRVSYFDEFANKKREKNITAPRIQTSSFEIGDQFPVQYIDRKLGQARPVRGVSWPAPIGFLCVITAMIILPLIGARDKGWT